MTRARRSAPRPARKPAPADDRPSRALSLAALAILLLAAFLIFFRLDQRLLWVDEAETALLGRNILVFGVPKADDGRSVVSQEAGKDYDHETYVWRWTPWLEKYVVAASFAVLGQSTFTARLPFALVGLLSVASMVPLGLALFRDRGTGVLAMAALALSVPFLLHARQCRYYSLAMLGSIWAVYFLVGLLRGSRGAVAGLVAAMTVLFHSNFLTFFCLAVGVLPCALLLDRERGALRRGAVAGLLVLLLNGPWVLYFNVFGRGEQRLGTVASHLRDYFELTNRYSFPLASLVLFLALAWFLRGRVLFLDRESWRPFAGLLLGAVVYVALLSAAPWSFYRYTISLLPLYAVLAAFMCRRVLAWNRVAGVALSATLLLTGLLHTASAWPFESATAGRQREGHSFPVCDTFFPLGNYLYELTHEYVGPMEALLAYLRENAHPGERVFTTYGDLVLKFYTDLEVRGGQTGEPLKGWPFPEWIILRSFFRFGDRPHLRRDAENMEAWLRTDVPWSSYREVKFPHADFPWDDIPEPQLHWYRPPAQGKPVQIFRRVTAP